VRTVSLVLLMLLLAMKTQAQAVAAPKFSENDSWTYQHTIESAATGWHQLRVESTVLQAGPTSITLSTRPVGSTVPPSQQLGSLDWSRFRSVNGRRTVVDKPLSFPLAVGKSWVVEYSENRPNREYGSEHFRTVYKVVGWEDVTVIAGTFHALKLEAEGQWSATLAPPAADAPGVMPVVPASKGAASTASGRTHQALWYVPAVKKWVRSVEEFYDSDGVRNKSYADELEAFRVTTEQPPALPCRASNDRGGGVSILPCGQGWPSQSKRLGSARPVPIRSGPR